MQSLPSFIASLELGPRQSVGDLAVFPLLRRGATAPRYDTLGDAVRAGSARVTEVSAAGSVPELQVVNKGNRPVLIVDGEELVGAKQNRIVNLTIMVPAKTTLTIPVSCVEQGRWHATTPDFAPAEHAFHATGRRSKLSQVTLSMAEEGSRRSDQSAIWSEISMKSARLGARSSTGAATAMYEHRRGSLDDLIAQITPLETQAGAVFAIRGQIAGLDVFDAPQTWAQLMPKLLRSYGLDALDAGTGGDAFAVPDPARFLDAIGKATCKVYPAIGAGQDFRYDGAGIVGAALSTDAGVVHAVAFPAANVQRPPVRRTSGRIWGA